MTTCFCCIALCSVSLVVLFLTLLAAEKITTGGLELNILKKLNGLRLLLPNSSTVLTKAIGLGAMAPSNKL